MPALTAPFARRFSATALLLLAGAAVRLAADAAGDLRAAKPEVNAQDDAGNTALPYAAQAKYPALPPAQVERLHQWIEAGAPWPANAPAVVSAETASAVFPTGQPLASLSP